MEFLKNKKRQIIQVVSAILYNLNFNGIKTKNIYQGDIKKICIPGLNCYSCIGAISSCPLGSLQTSISNIKYNSFSFLVIGLIIIFSIILGRIICGFLCPFGLLQEILYKIKTKKIKKNKITKKLTKIKYLILILFVFIFSFILKSPSFCKFICPQGTLEAGIPLVILKKELQKLIGKIFNLKIMILFIVIVGSIFLYRFFCSYICPLGAIYSLFNKISLFGVVVDNEKCINCGQCIKICKMNINKVGDSECIACGSCIKGCFKKAIKIKNRYI